MEKTAIQQLYDMLSAPNGVSRIAEMKEWYLTVERKQIEDAHWRGQSFNNELPSEYYVQTYGK